MPPNPSETIFSGIDIFSSLPYTVTKGFPKTGHVGWKFLQLSYTLLGELMLRLAHVRKLRSFSLTLIT